MLDFAVIDVETANADESTICQISIVTFINGEIVDEWKSFINPDARFSSKNTKIHGIRRKDIKNAPYIRNIVQVLHDKLDGKVIANYTNFDKRALSGALNGQFDNHLWLDITDIVREQYNQFRYRGYGLKPIAQFLHIKNDNHHDALNDAIVAGRILVAAVRESGRSFQYWKERFVQNPLPIAQPIEKDEDYYIQLLQISRDISFHVYVESEALGKPFPVTYKYRNKKELADLNEYIAKNKNISYPHFLLMQIAINWGYDKSQDGYSLSRDNKELFSEIFNNYWIVLRELHQQQEDSISNEAGLYNTRVRVVYDNSKVCQTGAQRQEFEDELNKFDNKIDYGDNSPYEDLIHEKEFIRKSDYKAKIEDKKIRQWLLSMILIVLLFIAMVSLIKH
jgi:DNA polymerase III epsilon subunit-like protein